MPTDEGKDENDKRIRRTHGDEYEERETDRREDESEASGDDEKGSRRSDRDGSLGRGGDRRPRGSA
jgi:hypothetical protein